MRNSSIILFFVAISITQLCATTFTNNPASYIAKFAPIAQEESRKSGIPASIYLAQAINESAFGTSELATVAFNHFGHKAVEWTGETYAKKDDDYINNELVNSAFRKYTSAEESYRGHSSFLKRAPYRNLAKYSNTDFYAWAKGIKAAGYATSPTYVEELTRIYITYNLHQFDGESAIKAGNIVIADDAVEAPTYFAPKDNDSDIVYLSNVSGNEAEIMALLDGKKTNTTATKVNAPQAVTQYPLHTPVPNASASQQTDIAFEQAKN